MMRFILPALGVATLSLGALTTPAFAAPTLSALIASDTSGATQVRYRRHHRYHRMRHGGAAASGNAANPEAPASQQRRGNTTRGYR